MISAVPRAKQIGAQDRAKRHGGKAGQKKCGIVCQIREAGSGPDKHGADNDDTYDAR